MSTVCTCVASQVFLGNLETTVTLVRIAPLYITESQELLHLDAALSLSKAVLCALSKFGKPRTALKDEQLMAIQRVYMARTCLYGY